MYDSRNNHIESLLLGLITEVTKVVCRIMQSFHPSMKSCILWILLLMRLRSLKILGNFSEENSQFVSLANMTPPIAHWLCTQNSFPIGLFWYFNIPFRAQTCLYPLYFLSVGKCCFLEASGMREKTTRIEERIYLLRITINLINELKQILLTDKTPTESIEMNSFKSN